MPARPEDPAKAKLYDQIAEALPFVYPTLVHYMFKMSPCSNSESCAWAIVNGVALETLNRKNAKPILNPVGFLRVSSKKQVYRFV